MKNSNPMPLSPEQLLAPRYEVIAPWPSGQYKKGDILIPHPTRNDVYLEKIIDDKPLVQNPELYPANLRKMDWWERQVSDLPKHVSYVSLTLKDKIYGNVESSEDEFYKARIFQEVTKWFFDKDEDLRYYTKTYNSGFGFDVCHSHLPATVDQYNEYINSKK